MANGQFSDDPRDLPGNLGLSDAARRPPPTDLRSSTFGKGIPMEVVKSEPQPERTGRSLGQRIALAIEGFGAGIQGRVPLAVRLNEIEAQREEQGLKRMIQLQGLLQKDVERLGDLPIDSRDDYVADRTAFYQKYGLNFGDFSGQAEILESPLMEIPEVRRIASISGVNGVQKFVTSKTGQEAIASYNATKLTPSIQTKLESLSDYFRENDPDVLKDGLRFAEIAARNNTLPESLRFSQAELGVMNRNQEAFSDILRQDEADTSGGIKIANTAEGVFAIAPDGTRERIGSIPPQPPVVVIDESGNEILVRREDAFGRAPRPTADALRTAREQREEKQKSVSQQIMVNNLIDVTERIAPLGTGRAGKTVNFFSELFAPVAPEAVEDFTQDNLGLSRAEFARYQADITMLENADAKEIVGPGQVSNFERDIIARAKALLNSGPAGRMAGLRAIKAAQYVNRAINEKFYTVDVPLADMIEDIEASGFSNEEAKRLALEISKIEGFIR